MVIDILDVVESWPVTARNANRESRELHPLAFGTNFSYMGTAAAPLGQHLYPARTPYSAPYDIVYIDSHANFGLEAVAEVMNPQDREVIQRLAAPINSTESTGIAGFVAQLHLFPSLREIILVVDLDLCGTLPDGDEGFRTITTAWTAALQEYYNGHSAAQSPTLTFEIPGWDDLPIGGRYSRSSNRQIDLQATPFTAPYRRRSVTGQTIIMNDFLPPWRHVRRPTL